MQFTPYSNNFRIAAQLSFNICVPSRAQSRGGKNWGRSCPSQRELPDVWLGCALWHSAHQISDFDDVQGCNECRTAQTTKLKLRLCFSELEHARSHSSISFCLIIVIMSLDTYPDAQQTQHWKPWETNCWAIILRQVPFSTAGGDILGTNCQEMPNVAEIVQATTPPAEAQIVFLDTAYSWNVCYLEPETSMTGSEYWIVDSHQAESSLDF